MVKGTAIVSMLIKNRVPYKSALLYQVREECKPLQAKITRELRKEQVKKSASLVKDGVIRYQLSQTKFIDDGITMLPSSKVVRKINMYKMIPNDPNSWFKRHSDDSILYYGTGELLAEIERDAHGRIYYRNGRVAMDYFRAEETNVGSRYIIYDCVEKNVDLTILGCFDETGNGVVYDRSGKVRLKYNQDEGEVLDPKIGPTCRWKWHDLNEPPEFETLHVENYITDIPMGLQKMIEKQIQTERHKKNLDMKSKLINDETKIQAEYNILLNQNKIVTTKEYKPFQIKMKTCKLNKYFAIHLMDQSHIHLYFRDEMVSLKFNLGLTLLSTELIDTELADVETVWTPYEQIIPKSPSVQRIKRVIDKTIKTHKVDAMRLSD